MGFVPYVFTPPTHGASPSPAIREPDEYAWLSHTSRAFWKARKNVLFGSRTTTASGIARSSGDQSLKMSYESIDGGARMQEGLTDWEVVGQGRFGPLEGWMVETENGIEDSSGEIRGDWRSSYVLLYFPPSSRQGEGYDLIISPSGVDDSSFTSKSSDACNRQMTIDYVRIIESKLKEHCHWEGKLDRVHLDDGFEVPLWIEEKPKKQTVWTNPDIYGEEKEEKGKKCLVQ